MGAMAVKVDGVRVREMSWLSELPLHVRDGLGNARGSDHDEISLLGP